MQPATNHRNFAPHRSAALTRAALFVFIALFLAACGGLGGEPEIVATIPPPTAAPDAGMDTDMDTSGSGGAMTAPISIPDIEAGATIYAENCVRCHAANGNGQSELYESEAIPFPGNFTDPAQIAGKTPADYYEIITNGRLEAVMPPWEEALTATERWNVAMYVYTLSYTPEQVAEGRSLVGSNQGMMQILGMILAEPEAAFTLTDAEIDAQIAEIAPDLSPEEQRAITIFTRAQTVSNLNGTEGAGPVPDQAPDDPAATEEADAGADAAAEAHAQATAAAGGGADAAAEAHAQATNAAGAADPAATEEAEGTQEVVAEPEAVTVTGVITNDTEGGDVPPGLPVTLRLFDTTFTETTLETTTDENNSFTFEDVPPPVGGVIFASTEYEGRTFSSPLIGAQGLTPDVDASISIYEITTDPSVLNILGQVQQINVMDNMLEIVHIYQFENTSDRVYSSDEQDEEGRYHTLEITLPVGAVITAFDNQTRYIVNDEEEPQTVIDTRPVFPGEENFIQLSYLVGYEGDAMIEYPVDYTQTGPTRLLLGNEEMSIESDNFELLGPQDLSGAIYFAYTNENDLSAGDTIRYNLSGGAQRIGTSGDSSVITSDNLGVVLVGLGVVLVVLGGGLYFLQQRRGEVVATSDGAMLDGLVRQIAELDAEHEAGKINHDLYQSRRKELKDRLTGLMDEQARAGDNSDEDDEKDGA